MMKKFFLLTLLIVGIFSSKFLFTDALEGDLISVITAQLLNLWRTDDVDFLGKTCQYSINPKISKWKLKYKSKFWCPGWVPFTGDATAKSRSGSIEKAIRDFATKAVSKNLVDPQDVDIWIKGFNS